MDAVGAAVAAELSALAGLSREAIRDLRATKFLAMGRKVEEKR
jgi:acetyl-CoA carboxylase carboxyl transferase subunit alpha